MRIDGIHFTGHCTQSAVAAGVRINVELVYGVESILVGARMDGVAWAGVDTSAVFNPNARLANDVWHAIHLKAPKPNVSLNL